MEFILNSTRAASAKRKKWPELMLYSYKVCRREEKVSPFTKTIGLHTAAFLAKGIFVRLKKKVFSVLNSVTWIGFEQNLAMLGHFGL
jgi:hypothetical protein